MCVCVCVYVCVFQGQRKGKPAYMLLECLLKLPRVFLCSPRQCTKQVFEMKQCLHPAHCKPSQINHQNPSVQILCCKGWSRSSSRESLFSSSTPFTGTELRDGVTETSLCAPRACLFYVSKALAFDSRPQIRWDGTVAFTVINK